MPSQVDRQYPAHYEDILTLKNGREVALRPILPTDGPLLLDLFHRISPESLYLRFLDHIHHLPEAMLYKFTHIDYHREFALVAEIDEKGKDTIVAVARYAHDRQQDLTDLAIVVRDDWQHCGLGKSLMLKIMDIGRDNGIRCFVSMMDPRNTIIRQTLEKLDCQVSYALRSGIFQVEILL